MNEAQYLNLANQLMNHLADSIERSDTDQILDADLVQGILTVILPSGKQFVINQHLPSQQIWVSSPFSGAAHYSYLESKNIWVDRTNKELFAAMKEDFMKVGISLTSV